MLYEGQISIGFKSIFIFHSDRNSSKTFHSILVFRRMEKIFRCLSYKDFFSSFFHISRIKKNFSSTKQEVIQSLYYEYFLYLLYYDKSSFIIANYLIQYYETFEYCLLFYLAILKGRNVTPSDIYGYCSCRFNRTKIEVDDLSSERKWRN